MSEVGTGIFLGNTPVGLINNNRFVLVNPFTEIPSQPVQNGLIVWLDAATYTSGTTWSDLSGNGNNATLVNTPTHSSTNGGQFDFNGTTQYATLYPLAGSTFTSSYTIQTWVKWDNITSDKCIFSQGAAANNQGLHLITRSSAVTGNQSRYGFNMYNNDEYSGTLAVTTSYRLITYTYNSSTFAKEMYINTSLDTPYSQTSNQYTNTSANAEIGRIGWSGTNINYFDGQLAQFYFYNRILTSDEITQNYNLSKDRYGL